MAGWPTHKRKKKERARRKRSALKRGKRERAQQ